MARSSSVTQSILRALEMLLRLIHRISDDEALPLLLALLLLRRLGVRGTSRPTAGEGSLAASLAAASRASAAAAAAGWFAFVSPKTASNSAFVVALAVASFRIVKYS